MNDSNNFALLTVFLQLRFFVGTTRLNLEISFLCCQPPIQWVEGAPSNEYINIGRWDEVSLPSLWSIVEIAPFFCKLSSILLGLFGGASIAPFSLLEDRAG